MIASAQDQHLVAVAVSCELRDWEWDSSSERQNNTEKIRNICH